MKNYFITLALGGSIFVLLQLSSCGTSDRTTGNDQAAAHSDIHGNDTTQSMNKPDTTVTGVSGNTNAVNSAGNAGDGSGMGSSSLTGPAKQTATNNK